MRIILFFITSVPFDVFQVQGSRFGVQGSRVQGFRVQGSGFRVQPRVYLFFSHRALWGTELFSLSALTFHLWASLALNFLTSQPPSFPALYLPVRVRLWLIFFNLFFAPFAVSAVKRVIRHHKIQAFFSGCLHRFLKVRPLGIYFYWFDCKQSEYASVQHSPEG